MNDGYGTPWWDPRRHEDRRPFLLARGKIKSAIRAWFEEQGFVEVETAALQVSPGNELHLHAFATRYAGLDGAERALYLHTSPEFACKKLLATGEARLFTFAPCFRNRELGALHEELEAAVHDRDRFFAVNERFHLRLLELADNRWRLQMVSDLRKVMKLNRHHSLFKAGRIEGSLAEHRAVMEALRARDGALAMRRMREHFASGLEAAT